LSRFAVSFGADFNFRVLVRDGLPGSKATFDGYSGFAVILNAPRNLDEFFPETRTRPEVLVVSLQLVMSPRDCRPQRHLLFSLL
jgi:hypothetical protein